MYVAQCFLEYCLSGFGNRKLCIIYENEAVPRFCFWNGTTKNIFPTRYEKCEHSDDF